MTAAVDWLGRRWLALWLAGATVYVAGAIAAPVLDRAGATAAAAVLYAAYRPMCHQLPHHSWFLFGPHAHYAWPVLQPYTDAPLARPLQALHQPVGDPSVGYQIAICQRDLATFGALLAASLVWAWVARRRAGPPPVLPGAWYLAALVPIGLDGLTQLVGWRTSTPLLRTATGAVFGAATAMFVLPLVAAAMSEPGSDGPTADMASGGGPSPTIAQRE